MATLSTHNIAEAIYLSSKDSSSKEQHELAGKVVQFLSKRKLLAKSQDILAQLQKIINKDEGRVEARVIAHDTLSPKTKTHITHALKERYQAKEIVLHEDIDKGVLGGYRIEVNDEVIDLTFKNKIEKLQEYLTTHHE